MKRGIFSAVATALVIFPLGVYAASINSAPNTLEESQSTMKQLAHNHFHHGKRRGKGDGIKKLLQQLDLTPEQSQKIEAIHQQFHTENETLYQEMQANHQQMRSLLASDASSEQLRQQHQKIQDLHQQLGGKRFESMLQVREILTPEQRAQMAELSAEHRGMRGGHNFGN